MKMKNNEKGIIKRYNPSLRSKESTAGITLIALIITIIVLLILSGVVISMLSGENGILRKAASAKEETEKQSKIEEERIELMTYVTEFETNKEKLVQEEKNSNLALRLYNTEDIKKIYSII